MQRALNIVVAVFAGLAITGSVGFLTSNLWAYGKQMSSFRAAGTRGIEQMKLRLKHSLKNGVNAGASYGSSTLLLGNYANMVVASIRASPEMSQYNYNGELLNLVDQEFTPIQKTFEDLNIKMSEFVDFLLRNADHPSNSIQYLQELDLSLSDAQPAVGFSQVGNKIIWWEEPQETTSGGRIQRQLSMIIEEDITKKLSEVEIPLGGPPPTVSPVAVDLSGEGLQFVTLDAGALFDCDDDGQRDRTAWVAGGTALLAYDRDGDGAIIRTEEISFTRYLEGAKTDLEGLAFFDTNHDRLLDAHDLCWHQFGVWRDENGDGVSQPGEFVALGQAGIASISLVSDHKASVQGDTLIYGRSHFTRTDGTIGAVGDVGFRYISAAA